MEDLFDVDKPYFAAWRGLHDIDSYPPDGSVFNHFGLSRSDSSMPLYYAALCGFANLVEQLMTKHPQQVNAIGGHYKTPAVAALAGSHFHLAQVLHRDKSSLDPRGCCDETPLHAAAYHGDLEIIQVLLECGVDVNAKREGAYTPLGHVVNAGHHNEARIARLLIAHGADPNARDWYGSTPLHRASERGSIEIVHSLIEHGANVEVKDTGGRTPLDVASGEQREEITKLLLEHLAK
jgi:ankyrin repeat protein